MAVAARRNNGNKTGMSREQGPKLSTPHCTPDVHEIHLTTPLIRRAATEMSPRCSRKAWLSTNNRPVHG